MSKPMRLKIPAEVRAELDKIPGRWTIEQGKRHLHIRVDGRLAGIMPHYSNGGQRQAVLNVASQIRRAAKGEKPNA